MTVDLKKILQFEFSDDTEENTLKLLLEVAKDNCSSVNMFGKIKRLLFPIVKHSAWL